MATTTKTTTIQLICVSHFIVYKELLDAEVYSVVAEVQDPELESFGSDF